MGEGAPQTHLATQAILDHLFVNPWFLAWHLDPSDVRQALIGDSVEIADAVRLLFALYAQTQGKSRYGDKTPYYVQHLDTLADLFPEAKFVHIIRDGRDVALSLREMPWGQSNLEWAALRWKTWVERGREAGRRLGARYLEIRYEDLVGAPEKILAMICEFLQVDFESRMFAFPSHANELLGPLPDSYIHENLRIPITKGLRNWRFQMSRNEVLRFDIVAGELLGDLGYERTGMRPDLKAQLHVLSARSMLALRARSRRLFTRLAGRRPG